MAGVGDGGGLLPRQRLVQAFTGCSLPPTAAGAPRGAVVLAVSHILSSSAAEAVVSSDDDARTKEGSVLPNASLVRVRWHGEHTHGSLFRPSRVLPGDCAEESGSDGKNDDQADAEDSSDSSIQMRYPICVPASQLLAYLAGMEELVFDVIDRSTRRIYGRSVISLRVADPSFASDYDHHDGDDEKARAEVVAALCQSNTLQEIYSTEEPSRVLGYLVVTIDVDWRQNHAAAALDADIDLAASIPLSSWAKPPSTPKVLVNTDLMGHTGTRNLPRAFTRNSPDVQRRLSFSSVSSDSTIREPINFSHAMPKTLTPPPSARTDLRDKEEHIRTRQPVSNDRLTRLLDKGRALQRLMSRAAEKHDAESAGDSQNSDCLLREAEIQALLAPEELDPANLIKENGDGDQWIQQLLGESTVNAKDIVQETTVDYDPDHRLRDLSSAVESMIATGGHNALHIRFESLEFESSTMNRLHQLRDVSVVTRSSPIQISVAHDDLAKLVKQRNGQSSAPSGQSDEDWLPAFKISSSLRKRRWQPNYSHTVPFATNTTHRLTLCKDTCRFRVRCEAQPALVGRQDRSRRRHRYPMHGKNANRLDLVGEIPASELFSMRPRELIVSVPLRFDVENNSAASHHSNAPTSRSNTARGKSSRRSACAGRITVALCLRTVPMDSMKDQSDDNHLEPIEMKRVDLQAAENSWDEGSRVSDSEQMSSIHSPSESSSESSRTCSAVQALRQQMPQTHTLQRHRPHNAPVPLSFALMIDSATVNPANATASAQLPILKTGSHTLRIEYAVPSFFGLPRQPSVKPVRRCVKSALFERQHSSHMNDRNRVTWMTKFSHMNAFPFDSTSDNVEGLIDGYLILEVWIDEKTVFPSHPDSTLVGIVKLPLRSFYDYFRSSNAIYDLCCQTVPCVDVDDIAVITNPLTALATGTVHVRVALGTSEQLLSLRTVINGVTRLQAAVRGYLLRRDLLRWGQYALSDTVGAEDSPDNRIRNDDKPVTDLSQDISLVVHKESGETSRSASNDVLHGAALNNRERNDSTSSGRPALVPSSDDSRSNQDIIVTSVDIRVEIRDCWADAHNPVDTTNNLSGCEVRGQLLLGKEEDQAILGVSSGVKFTLWWDASNTDRNSQFVHSFRSSEFAGSADHNGIAVNELTALFRVVLDEEWPGSVSNANTKAALGAVDLSTLLTSSQEAIRGRSHSLGASTEDSKVDHIRDASFIRTHSHAVDVPLIWSFNENQRLISLSNCDSSTYPASVLPIRVTFQVMYQCVIGQNEEPHCSIQNPHVPAPNGEPAAASTTVTSIEKLLPATILLCLDFQRICDFKSLFKEWSKSDEVSRSGAAKGIIKRLDETGSPELALECMLCLGTEVHPNELEEVSRELIQLGNTGMDGRQGLWYKKIQFDGVHLDVVNGVQMLPSTARAEVNVVVHQELIENFQENSLQVSLQIKSSSGQNLNSCSGGQERSPPGVTTIGICSIPLTAILFRPTGVQGSFPFTIDDHSAGRLGVHFYIDKDDDAPSIPPVPTPGQTLSSTNAQAIIHEVIKTCQYDGEDVGGASDRKHTIATSPSPTTDEVLSMNTWSRTSHEETPYDTSMSTVVASIHETTHGIDQRLRQLMSWPADSPQYTHQKKMVEIADFADAGCPPSSDEVGANVRVNVPEPAKIPIFSELVAFEEYELPVLQPPSPTAGALSNSEADSSLGGIDSIRKDKNDEEGNAQDANRSPADSGVGHSGGSSPSFFLPPITLESLGIDEIEFSPASTPVFLHPQDAPSNANIEPRNGQGLDPAGSTEGAISAASSRSESNVLSVHDSYEARCAMSSEGGDDNEDNAEHVDAHNCLDAREDGEDPTEIPISIMLDDENDSTRADVYSADDPRNQGSGLGYGDSDDNVDNQCDLLSTSGSQIGSALSEDGCEPFIDAEHKYGQATAETTSPRVVMSMPGSEISRPPSPAGDLSPETITLDALEFDAPDRQRVHNATTDLDCTEDVTSELSHLNQNIDSASENDCDFRDDSPTSQCKKAPCLSIEVSDDHENNERSCNDVNSIHHLSHHVTNVVDPIDTTLLPLSPNVTTLEDKGVQVDRSEHTLEGNVPEREGEISARRDEDVSQEEVPDCAHIGATSPSYSMSDASKSVSYVDKSMQTIETGPVKTAVASNHSDASLSASPRMEDVKLISTNTSEVDPHTRDTHVNSSQTMDGCESMASSPEMLPQEKFHLAWQLLHELRGLYPDDSSTYEIPAPQGEQLIVHRSLDTSIETKISNSNVSSSGVQRDGRLTTPERNPTIPNESKRLPSQLSPQGKSYQEQRSVESVPGSSALLGLSENNISPWQWSDAKMLKKEMQHRVYCSDDNFETALSISQTLDSQKETQLPTTDVTMPGSDKSELHTAIFGPIRASNKLNPTHLIRTTRAFFNKDSETERIARIMQGTLNYWLDDDGSSGEDSASTSEDAPDADRNRYAFY